MPFPTQPAFVHYSDFDSRSDEHPCMEWMKRFRDDFDKATFDPKWYHPEFVYVTPDGIAHEGREKAIEELKALYGPLPGWHHEPFFMNCIDRDFGYEMIGKATLWANLPGTPVAGETKKKDANGKEWDFAVPGTFRFHYVKDANDFSLTRCEITADRTPLLLGMVKRGVVSTKELGI